MFQIIVMTGSTEGPEELKGLPKNAEKAIRDFLPYKRYVLVDAGLLQEVERSGGHRRPDPVGEFAGPFHSERLPRKLVGERHPAALELYAGPLIVFL